MAMAQPFMGSQLIVLKQLSIDMGNKDFDVYQRFKAFHKNSLEEYNPTPENVARWRQHILHHESVLAMFNPEKKFRKEYVQEFVDLIEKRKVRFWEEMNVGIKSHYESIAARFPRNQVYAVGSRVRGDYVERYDPEQVRLWRKEAFKRDVKVSDYDFIVEGLNPDGRELPEYADWLKYFPEQEKIPIPMWEWSNLPKSEYPNILKMLSEGDEKGLHEIYKKYELSTYRYCCNLSGMVDWFRIAEQQGLFNEEENEQEASYRLDNQQY